MKSGLDVVIDNTGALLKAVEELASKQVLVGIPEDTAGRSGDEGANNALIAYISEHGEPALNIPARPSFVPGIRDAKDQITTILKSTADAALVGDAASIDRGLHAAGMIAQNAIKARIVSGPFEPLKSGTIAKRRAAGRTGTKPLIDTSQFLGAISYVVTKITGRKS